ncbi:MAG: thioesterase family protein [Treponematales bacterium]
MICFCSLKVRTYELDHNGHVNNANYLNYLEYARHSFLASIGFDYDAMLKAGYGVYVARIEIDYRKPARLNDELVIETWPVKKGAVSGVLGQRIRLGEETVAEARVTWAFVDSRGVPRRLPPEFDLPGLRPETN